MAKYWACILFVSVCFLHTASGQDYKSLMAKSRKLMMYQNDSAFYFIDKAIEEAPDFEREMEARMVKANMHINISNSFDTTVDQLQEILNEHEDRLTPILKARLYEGLSMAYGHIGEYNNQISSSYKLLEYAKMAQSTPFITNANFFLFEANYLLGLKDESIKFATEAFDVADRGNYKFGVQQVAFKFFSYYRDRLEEEPLATYLFRYFEITNPSLLPQDGTHIAFEYLDKYKLNDDQLRTLLDKAKVEKNYNGWLRMAFKLCKNLTDKNDGSKAISLLDELIAENPNALFLSNKKYIYLLKYESHKSVNDFEKANLYLENYYQLGDSLQGIEVTKFGDSLNILFETAIKDQQIASQEIVMLKNQRQRNYLIVGILSLILFTGFIFYILRKRHAYQEAISEKEKEIQIEKINKLQQEQKIVALDYMLMGEENERKRIAKDLHDSLGALLVTAKLQIQKIFKDLDKIDKNAYEQTGKIIFDAAQEVRRISHDMMPDALVNLGLTSALDDLVQKVNSNDQLQVSFNHFDLNESIFSEQLKLGVYRIIQELVQNVIKHAKASHMIIQLSQEDNILTLEVEDNGIGFNLDPLQNKKGIGLKNIESRIKYLNGVMEIDSKNGGPTVFTFKMPLEANLELSKTEI